MLFSELYKTMVNKGTFVGFRGAIAPPLDLPLMNSDKAQWKEPELTILINEVGAVAQIYKASKLAFYNANLSPWGLKCQSCHCFAYLLSHMKK